MVNNRMLKTTKIRIGVLISGTGTNFQAIIDGCNAGNIHGKVVFAGSDNPDATGLNRAAKHNIPHFVVDYSSIIRSFDKTPEKIRLPRDFNLKDALSKTRLFKQNTDKNRIKRFLITRAIAEAKLFDKIKGFKFDLIALAGFMRKLSPYFIDKISALPEKPCIINIHPALLPAFPGMDGYADTFDYGCKIGGCTVHFVDYGEDSGPIIAQRAFEINSDDTLETVRAKGLKIEWDLYPESIQLVARNRVKITDMEI